MDLHLGHLYLAISLFALGFIGIFHKVADQYRCRPPAIAVTVYFWAGLLSMLYLFAVGRIGLVHSMSGKLYLIAGICGFLSALAILAFQAGLRYGEGKIATSWVIINLSTVLPTILSIVIYKEAINFLKIVALAMVVIAMFLLWKDKKIDEEAQAAESSAKEKYSTELNSTGKGGA